MTQEITWREAQPFKATANEMAASVFTEHADMEAWQNALSYELAWYNQAIKDGYIFSRQRNWTEYNIAYQAYESRCKLLGKPFITVEESKDEYGHTGVVVWFRLNAKTGIRHWTREGLEELSRIMDQEAKNCSKSKGYGYWLGGCDVGVKHTPRSRIPFLVKEYNNVAEKHTAINTNNSRAAWRVIDKIVQEHRAAWRAARDKESETAGGE